jgi:GTP-binding protein
VVLMLFDATETISQVDEHLVEEISAHSKPCIFVVNKWDLLAKSMPTEKWVRYLNDTFRTMRYAPIAFITGQTGKNVKALLNHAQMLFKQSLDRVKTSELNRLVRAALEKHPPPMHGMLRPKIYYATQVGTQPPTIVLVCNEPNAFQPDYRRYLLGVLRDYLKFGEIPIKLYLKKRASRDKKDEIKHGEEAEPVVIELDGGDGGSIFDDDVAPAGPDDETSSDIYGDQVKAEETEEE